MGGHARLRHGRAGRTRAGHPAGRPVLPRTYAAAGPGQDDAASGGDVDVPVVVHLDHGYTADECREALDSGFTSLMFDGSRKPLAENIAETARIAEMAHAAGISCEGEIGFVGYSGGEASAGRTRKRLRFSPVKAGWTPWRSRWATCICNRTARAGWTSRASARSRRSRDVPLVIHGGSGVPVAQRAALASGLAHLQVQHWHRTQDGLRGRPARCGEQGPGPL
jgi:hypothetical protein